MSSPVPGRSPWLVCTVAVALIVAACGGPAPTPSPSPTPAPTAVPTVAPTLSPAQEQAIYAAIERQVEAIRGLTPMSSVAPAVLDEAGLRAELARLNALDNPPEEVAKSERLLKALGVLPADASLAAITAEFQGSQIAGFYVPTDGRLYVVSRSGGLGAVERTTFAHEYTHALQDQHFPLLDELDDAGAGPSDSDHDLGRLALIEGDASLAMTYWAQQHLQPLELLSILSSSLDPAQTAALNAMPSFLRESTLFPYQEGLQFVLGIQIGGGWSAVDAAFATPPDTSEQVLHPEKFRLHEPEVAVALPAGLVGRLGAGWAVETDDAMGELQVRAWLAARGVVAATVKPAAAGWGGDRVGLLQGPNGAWLLVLATAWDTRADAAEFLAAAKTAVATGASPATTLVKSDRTYVLIASDAATLLVGQAALS